MQLRTVFFCSFLALPILAACGDDETGSGGGDSSTTGASSSSGTPTSTGANNTTTSSAGTGGDPTGGGGDPTGGGGDPTGGGGDPTGGGGGPPELSCETYCDTIMQACDDDLQYPSSEECLTSCATFGVGEYADADASLGCHQYHANAALGDPVIHCGHAGPMGDGQCGADPCENFCQIAPEVCPDTYASAEVCTKICGGFTVGEYSVNPPATGDTLGCRMYHLMAAVTDPATHCDHTAADSSQCN